MSAILIIVLLMLVGLDNILSLGLSCKPSLRSFRWQSKLRNAIVHVPLGDRAYTIDIGEQPLCSAPPCLREANILIVTNEVVAPLYLDSTLGALDSIGNKVNGLILHDGEEYKTMETIMQILDAAVACGLDRDGVFVALGGGVIGDLCGFAAAIYQRGVRFVQAPTTLMAMVDSSVGGKTGVNHARGKNLIGAFHQPSAVVVDLCTLSSLPDREYASALPEIVKYGLMADGEFLSFLEVHWDALLQRDAAVIRAIVSHCCRLKAQVVASDETEHNGARALLNLGHTFGHAIECGAGYGTWLHGEAVGVGILMAADLSRRMSWIDDSLVDRIRRLFERSSLPKWPPLGLSPDLLLELMKRDKKVSKEQLRLVLLKGTVGGAVLTTDFDRAALDETLRHFCHSHGQSVDTIG